MGSKKGKDDKVIDILFTGMTQEQNFYWVRFAVFSALHASLIIFDSSQSHLSLLTLNIFGLVLAIIWFMVQLISRLYANVSKKIYYKEAKKYDIPERPYPKYYMRWMATTNLGVLVSAFMVVFWIFMLINPK